MLCLAFPANADCQEALGAIKQPKFEGAFNACSQAADQGQAGAQLYLGYFYENKFGVAKDKKLALAWYLKAANQGHAGAQWVLGKRFYKSRLVRRDYKQAAFWLLKSAAQGFAGAQTMLGMMHEKGRGVEDSYAKALAYYKIAAEQGGDSEAQFSLGRMYEGGKGVEVSGDHLQNIDEGVAWCDDLLLGGHCHNLEEVLRNC